MNHFCPKYKLCTVFAWHQAVWLTATWLLQHKDRIDVNLIKPAVDWRKAGSRNAMMSAAIAR